MEKLKKRAEEFLKFYREKATEYLIYAEDHKETILQKLSDKRIEIFKDRE